MNKIQELGIWILGSHLLAWINLTFIQSQNFSHGVQLHFPDVCHWSNTSLQVSNFYCQKASVCTFSTFHTWRIFSFSSQEFHKLWHKLKNYLNTWLEDCLRFEKMHRHPSCNRYIPFSKNSNSTRMSFLWFFYGSVHQRLPCCICQERVFPWHFSVQSKKWVFCFPFQRYRTWRCGLLEFLAKWYLNTRLCSP